MIVFLNLKMNKIIVYKLDLSINFLSSPSSFPLLVALMMLIKTLSIAIQRILIISNKSNFDQSQIPDIWELRLN